MACYIDLDASKEEQKNQIKTSCEIIDKKYQNRIKELELKMRQQCDSLEAKEHIDAILNHLVSLDELGIRVSYFNFKEE